VTVCWVLGHSSLHRNKEADKHAKLAAAGHHNDSPSVSLPHYLCHHTLPLSISALKELQSKYTTEQWKLLWNKSPHFYNLNHID
ncbi:hypothetical protein BDR04DRAFT_934446, partial [Suillus decipiens]